MLGNSFDHWLLYPKTRALRLTIVLLTALSGIAHGQITLDGSLGPRGPLTGPNFVIPAEVGQTRGGNLFHSFGLFNVLTNQSATFTGPNYDQQYLKSSDGRAALNDRRSCALRDSRRKLIPAQSRRRVIWPECFTRREGLISRKHGRLFAVRGWSAISC